VRKATAAISAVVILLLAVPAAAAGGDIAGFFAMYYEQQIAGAVYKGPLDFLRDAAARHAGSDKVLQSDASHAVTVDRANGYLQISDSAGTDQVLTMALYRKSDGGLVLAVGSSNCADACTFVVEFFAASGDRLLPLARDTIVPAIEPAQFLKPGQAVPKMLASRSPSINYVPARIGTTLTLKPWYGYEIEAQMDEATRRAIRDVALAWDRTQGRFLMER
jgi:hypothetical protein